DPRIQKARPHPGQLAVAEHLRALVRQSEIRESHRQNDPRVQDAYSLRCIPQVHGAARDALGYVEKILEIESAGATDNPLVFPESGDVISGGNFHGAPLALALDFGKRGKFACHRIAGSRGSARASTATEGRCWGGTRLRDGPKIC